MRADLLLGLVFSLITLVATIAMIVSFKPGGPAFQFTQTYQWIPQFGIHYAVGVDGIALVLIGMTAVLMPVVVLASWNDADPRPAAGAAASNGAAPAGSAGPLRQGGHRNDRSHQGEAARMQRREIRRARGWV